MRLTPVVPLLLLALTSCTIAPPEKGAQDLTIKVVLALQNNRCVVSFVDSGLKSELKAIAYTNHAVIWQVTQNRCGEKRKVTVKGLGLRQLKLRTTGAPAAWLDRCSTLNLIPASIGIPPAFRCEIPSSTTGSWEGIYDYEIDGDEIDPADPGVNVRRNG